MLTKQETLLGKGAWEGSSRVREPRRTALQVVAVSGWFYGLASRLSLISRLAWPIFGLAPGPSCWHMHLLAKIDPSTKDPGRLTSSWFVFRAAPRSLSGPPAGRQLTHMLSLCLPRWAVLVTGALTKAVHSSPFHLSPHDNSISAFLAHWCVLVFLSC